MSLRKSTKRKRKTKPRSKPNKGDRTMIRKELNTRSPLRILEKSTHGGVGKGNIGVIAARKGIGKTACLVHLATDQLFQEKHVIHVSFSTDTSHIIAWYEDIFEEIAKRYKLDNAMDVHDDITKNRVIMNFRQDGVSADQVNKSISSMIKDGHFSADSVIIDGYDFSKITKDEFASFKKLAEALQIEIWFSVTLPKDGKVLDSKGVPSVLNEVVSGIAIVIILEPMDSFVRFKLVKDHDVVPVENMHLKLDPQILLIAEEA
jgi:predicted ATP-dependent serine protease